MSASEVTIWYTGDLMLCGKPGRMDAVVKLADYESLRAERDQLKSRNIELVGRLQHFSEVATRHENDKIAAESDRDALAARVVELEAIHPLSNYELHSAEVLAANLPAYADLIDCGRDCEHCYTEHDTNAFVCCRQDSEEGCAFNNATEIREAAQLLAKLPKPVGIYAIKLPESPT